MARILSIQSQVIYGHVGNSAARFALERLGHEVLALPTTLLAHHPGHGRVKGMETEPAQMQVWIKELGSKGWLAKCDAVITGYMPDADQVEVAAKLIEHMKHANPELLYLCDPVFGDDKGGHYLPKAVSASIKKHLLPLADLTTPNAFEAAHLSGQRIRERQTALKVASVLGPPNVFITSVPEGNDELGTLSWQRPGDWNRPGGLQKTGSWIVTTPRHKWAPHGTGDLFSALLLGHMLNQLPVPSALRRASAGVRDLITEAERLGADELPLIANQGSLLQPASEAKLTPLGAGAEGQWVAGVDEAAGGWLVVMKDLSGHTPSRFRLCKTFEDVLALPERPAVITVNVPIGLPEIAARGGRKCDTAARSVLGPRRSLVFTPPARAALEADEFGAACEINLKHSIPPRKVSKQTFGIFAKIREVDAAIAASDQVRVFESHPEVAFWAMNGEKHVGVPKRVKNAPHADGLAFRRSLLAANGFEVKFIASFDMSRSKAAQEDFLDACASTWTAVRIATGEAIQMPLNPARDARGLRMEIWG